MDVESVALADEDQISQQSIVMKRFDAFNDVRRVATVHLLIHDVILKCRLHVVREKIVTVRRACCLGYFSEGEGAKERE